MADAYAREQHRHSAARSAYGRNRTPTVRMAQLTEECSNTYLLVIIVHPLLRESDLDAMPQAPSPWSNVSNIAYKMRRAIPSTCSSIGVPETCDRAILQMRHRMCRYMLPP